MIIDSDDTQPERTLLASGRTQAATLVSAVVLFRIAVIKGSVIAIVATGVALAAMIAQGWSSRRSHTRQVESIQQSSFPVPALISAGVVAMISLAGAVLSLTAAS